MVDRQVAVDHFLKVCADVAEAEVQALEGLQLRCYAGGKCADGYVADITEEMLDADFFCFFCFDSGGCVDKGFSRGCAILAYISRVDFEHFNLQSYIFNLFHRKIRVCRHSNFLRLHIDDDEERIWGVPFEQFVDLKI